MQKADFNRGMMAYVYNKYIWGKGGKENKYMVVLVWNIVDSSVRLSVSRIERQRNPKI